MMESTTITDTLDETKLKRIILNLEKKTTENQKLRIKHAESPTKFAISETELFASLDEFQSVSAQPELYHILISKKALSCLMGLLEHENSDISAKVVAIFQELTEIDETSDQEATEKIIGALKDEHVVKMLITNLHRLNSDQKDEAQAIVNTLSIIDNLIDFDSNFASDHSEELISWMTSQISKSTGYNSVKLSIAELLSVLLMTAKDNKLILGSLKGIDILLQQMSIYMRVAPATGEEHEFLEQIVNCLCTAILDCEENRESFIEEEGVDLIHLILREKRDCVKESNIKLLSLKLFNHVLTTDKNDNESVTKCCERFVQILGLKVIFPIFNNPKLILSRRIKRREYHQTLDEIEEHSAAILLAMLKYCKNSELSQRVLIKFAESNFEKLDRLFKLHDKYYKLVSLQAQESEGTREDGREQDIKRSSALFTLRLVDYMILLSTYLSHHFETYDPKSGETFINWIGKLVVRRPELRHQIALEVGKHIDEVADSLEEQNSLELLIRYFDSLCKESMSKNKHQTSGQ